MTFLQNKFNITDKAKAVLQSVKKARCPCCRQAKKHDDLTTVLQKIEGLFNANTVWCQLFLGKNISKAKQNFLFTDKWACDMCIDKQQALLAEPSNQMYCDYLPFLAYFDKTHTCTTCSKKYVYTKKEQMFWYEELKFWVQAEAVNCKNCRAIKRDRKDRIREAQIRLQALLPMLDKSNVEQLTEIIECYKLTESHKRVEEYESILKKLTGAS